MATLVVLAVAVSLGGLGSALAAAEGIAKPGTGKAGSGTQTTTPQDDALTDGDFLISAEPIIGTHPSHAVVAATARVIALGEYPYWVSLSASVFPATPWVVVAFPANPIFAGSSAGFTVLTRGAAPGLYVITVMGTGHGEVVHTSTFRIHVS